MQFFDLRNLNYYCDSKGHLEQPVIPSLFLSFFDPSFKKRKNLKFKGKRPI